MIGGVPSSASPAASPSSHTPTAAGEEAESDVAMGVTMTVLASRSQRCGNVAV